MRKLVIVLLLVSLAITFFCIPASADPGRQTKAPTQGIMSSDPMYGSFDSSEIDPDQVSTNGGLIMKWGCSISNLGNGTVDIYGYTQTYSVEDSVKVTAYLQKWTGSRWEDVIGVAGSASNTNYISASKNIAVSRGYYYRTWAVHTAANASASEITYSTSSYIYVN